MNQKVNLKEVKRLKNELVLIWCLLVSWQPCISVIYKIRDNLQCENPTQNKCDKKVKTNVFEDVT